ncbi:MAG: YceI family protein [Anaerolineales bacterium]|nr:YceI family protein [Anaerolineales bacterium]
MKRRDLNNRYNPSLVPSRNVQKNLTYSLLLLGTGTIFGAVVGIFGFMFVTGGTAEPSAPISAPTLSLESFNTTSPEAVATMADHDTMPSATAAATVLPEEPESVPDDTPAADTGSVQLYRIVAEESEARFSVYETFPEGTAVGRTNQIAGDIIVDFGTPLNSQVGLIRINVRTLQTDDPDRDRSIRCCVLLTAQPEYEFAEFQPTAIAQLPEEIIPGQSVELTITGDLTLKGVTNEVVFDVTVIVVSENVLQGSASAIVNRQLFGILNSSENGFDYHGVSDIVTLEFDFVANAVSE